MALLNCQDGLTGQNIIDAVNENTGLDTVERLVVLGASIMNGAFGDPVENIQSMAEYGFGNIKIDEHAVPGYSTSDVLLALPTILLTYTGLSNIRFIMHVGGNNVTDSKPFSNAEYSYLQSMTEDINEIIDLIEAAGHTVYLSNISYRDYGTPEDEGSLPYNKAIVEPIIKSRTPYAWDFSKDKPILDMYTWFFNHQNYFVDGVHITGEGSDALRAQWMVWLNKLMTANVKTYYSASGQSITINIGDADAVTGNGITSVDLQGGGLSSVLGVKGGLIILQRAGGTSNERGRGNAGDDSPTVSNDVLLKSYAYILASDGVMYVNICGLLPGATGFMKVGASRNSDDGMRVSVYTVGDNYVTLDAGLNPPQPSAPIPFEVNQYGAVTLSVEADIGSSNAYISGIELIFD